MNEAKGIAFTSFEKNGWVISFTVRDGGRKEAEDSVLAVLDIINGVLEPEGCIPFRSYTNRWAEDTPASVAQAQVQPESADDEDPFLIPQELEPAQAPTNPTLYGVVDFRPPAGDLNPGDKFEILVDQYILADDKIIFCKEGNEYPEIHTHNLNDYGKRDMQEFFGANWGAVFVPTVDIANIPGGAFVIEITGSNKRRDRGSGKGNVFRNLSGARRP